MTKYRSDEYNNRVPFGKYMYTKELKYLIGVLNTMTVKRIEKVDTNVSRGVYVSDNEKIKLNESLLEDLEHELHWREY